jgi:hypothetical protein
MIELGLAIANGHWREQFGLSAHGDCHVVCCRRYV